MTTYLIANGQLSVDGVVLGSVCDVVVSERDRLVELAMAGQSFRILAPDEILADLKGLRETMRRQSIEISDESFEDQVRAYEAARKAWRMPPPLPACYVEPRRRVAQWKTERRGRRS